MKTIALHIDGEINFAELAEIFQSAGYAIRMVGSQIIVSRVPAWLRADAKVEPTNVVKMPPRIRRQR